MQKAWLLLIFLILSFNSVKARLNATYAENLKQHGAEITREVFSENPFTGYITFSVDKDWKLKAYFVNGRVRSEHLLPVDPEKPKILTRSEVRNWSAKMFRMVDRGVFHKQMNQPRVKAFFFDKGLISYEYEIEQKRTLGYRSVKVLFYEPGRTYRNIKIKAYI